MGPGCAGLQPTCAAIRAGKDICLANKETLIAGGPYVLPLAKEHGVHILPADSEHSVCDCTSSTPFHPKLLKPLGCYDSDFFKCLRHCCQFPKYHDGRSQVSESVSFSLVWEKNAS